jgi:hypothetical protein
MKYGYRGDYMREEEDRVSQKRIALGCGIFAAVSVTALIAAFLL